MSTARYLCLTVLNNTKTESDHINCLLDTKFNYLIKTIIILNYIYF